MFRVTFVRRDLQGQKYDLVNDLEKKILEFIQKDVNVTYLSLSRSLNISVATIKRHIGKLKGKGIIQRVGSDKKGVWEIIK